MKRAFPFPGTRSHYAPDSICRIEHVRIDIDVEVEQRRIHGRTSLTLSPIGGLSERAAAGGASTWVPIDAVEFDIEAVSCGGQALPYRYDGQVLRVDLAPALAAAPDEAGRKRSRLVVDIDYGTRPRRGLYFVGPDEGYPDKPSQVWSQGQDQDSRYWFPCFDTPHAKATSELIARVPAHFSAVSNGTCMANRVDADSGKRTVHWRLDTPHSCYLITLVAAELSEIRDSAGALDVRYYVTPGREDDARRTLERTPQMIELFSRTFGCDYPYEKYAQIFVADFIFGGMENTTATSLTDQILLDERAALDADADGLVSHELAHQWFGDLVTCRDWSQSWLNEGFATYSEYVWRAHVQGEDEGALVRQAWTRMYFQEDKQRYRRPIATRMFQVPIEIFDRHLYEKGALVLHMLRRELGDAAFWRAIARYLADNRGGSVEIRDLVRAIERATGRMMDWFFDQWLTEGAGHPELAISYEWEPERGLARVNVSQTQTVDETTPLFRMPASMRFRVGERDVDLPFEITEEAQSFFFALDQAPTQAIFDPGKHLLAEVTMNKGQNLLLAELAEATEAVDRMAAARALGKQGGERATEALIRGLGEDPFWSVRAACAEALAGLRSERACAALVAAVSSTEHPKARRAVVRALGAFRGHDSAAEALRRVVEDGDESCFVEASACEALGRTRAPGALESLSQALTRDSYRDVIRSHVYMGLAATREEDALPILREGTRYGRPSGGRRAATETLARLAAEHGGREAIRARELCVDLLRDRDFMVQFSAIQALAALGDARAVPALEAMMTRELDGRLRRRARETVRDLRAATRPNEERAAMRDEIDQLRQRVGKLEERLSAALTFIEANAEGKGGQSDKKKAGKNKKKAGKGKGKAGKAKSDKAKSDNDTADASSSSDA
ncbi:M1 family aminopeptidase [Haliangium ochraceum]|uniref:Aminopeptidase N n=1 Tax=Haliangium ochraceum (strain DSM 14365 / JCM 11303 / SMP-2) TaxID=502025 RepID=D0LYM6_HALO1|nr:M1 family aminopeptidase [Haliangium ochraceum]ACY17892.1 Peptidase M1 membrane alanine aminopeptidase [Haliangium ochraceum DSM 14365]